MNLDRVVPEHVQDRVPSSQSKLNRLAAGMDEVVRLGYGDVGFVTPKPIRDAARRALDSGHTRYEDLFPLYEAIAEKLERDNGIRVNPAQDIVIAEGCKAVCALIMATFIEAGDEVILFSPGAYVYDTTRFYGGKPVEVLLDAERGFRINPDEVAGAITPRTKFISVTTPDAPTGVVHRREDLERVAELALKYDLLVISDEIYEKINYGPTPHFSIGSLPGMGERTITVNGFSKGYAMTGWRVGYAAGPPDLVSVMKRVHELRAIWINSIAQHAALAAYRGPQAMVDEMVKEYRRRMMLLVDGINSIDGLTLPFPEATYYAWLNVAELGLDGETCAEHLLLSQQVQVNPGSIFKRGGEDYIRLSCSAPENELREGIGRFTHAVDSLRESGPILETSA